MRQATDIVGIKPVPPIRLQGPEPFKVGLCILREGKFAAFGTGLYEGALLGCQDVAQLIGRDIQLILEEEAEDTLSAWRVVANFASKRVVAVIGPMTYQGAGVLLPLLDIAGLGSVIPSIRNPDITRAGYKNVFRVDFDGGAQAQVQAHYAFTDLWRRKVLIAHSTTVFWTGLANAFEAEFKGTVVRRVPFAPGTTVFSSVVSDIRSSQPDLVYAAADAPDLITLLVAMRDGKVRAPFMACAALPGSELMAVHGLKLDDVYVTECSSPAGTYEDFASRFSTFFGHDPGYYSPEGHDSVGAIARALGTSVRGGAATRFALGGTTEVSPASLVRTLRDVSFRGATGRVDFNDRGDRREQGSIAVVAAAELKPPLAPARQTGSASATSMPAAQPRKPERPRQVFYSYSHKDEDLRSQLDTHLSIMKRQGVITSWSCREITAGTEWEGEIRSYLNSAQLILLLVSSDFLDSDYCYDVELKRAFERHDAGDATVIPVILRACDWAHPPLSNLQALPTGAVPVTSWLNRDEAFTDIAKGIRKAIEEMEGRAN
ncbi:MAG: ABC transporter substrate-binding protein [Chloroflexi bacterium]|nr:ABC transporter substrate-binding protein [Chloroflexota bacterium]